jgi:ketosteroid isomerase-like protein
LNVTIASKRVSGLLSLMLVFVSGCATQGGAQGSGEGVVNAEANRNLIMGSYAAFQRGDIDTLLSLLDDSVVWQVPGPSTIPFAGRFEGKNGVRRFFRAAIDTLEVHEQGVLESYAEGDRVVVTGYERMTVRSTGKEIAVRWMHAYRFRNGKIIAFEEFVDTAAQAAGFAP